MNDDKPEIEIEAETEEAEDLRPERVCGNCAWSMEYRYVNRVGGATYMRACRRTLWSTGGPADGVRGRVFADAPACPAYVPRGC